MGSYLSEESQWKIRGHILKYHTDSSIIDSEGVATLVLPKSRRVAFNDGQII